MRIGILGAGRVGGNLGRIWSRSGHEVTFGVPDPTDPKVLDLLASLDGRARAVAVAEAATFGDVIVLATPWLATRQSLESAGDLAGKVLVDCTNPHLADLSGLEIGHTTSAAEEVARWAPGARVVKAFNTVGHAHLGNADFASGPLTGFLCGDDPDAKRLVAVLVEEAGLDPVDAGPLQRARLLEAVAMLGIHLAVHQGLGGDIGIALVRRR
jgi:predicted dinucleotide-binding enzyme